MCECEQPARPAEDPHRSGRRFGSGPISATWFNQPWLADKTPPRPLTVRLRGRLGRYGFDVRSYDVGDTTATADFAPVYPASEQATRRSGCAISSTRRCRSCARSAARQLACRTRSRAPRAMRWRPSAARPTSGRPSGDAPGRLALDGVARYPAPGRRPRVAPPAPQSRRPRSGDPGEVIARYRDALPFRTHRSTGRGRSRRSTATCAAPAVQRLLQGDVGSGKTVVALYALLRAVEAGRQGALMAPTETLAEQHFLTIEGICAELGVAVVLLTGAQRKRARASPMLASGEAQIAVGTHALIQAGVEFRGPRRRGRRRAAPLRRRAAQGARRAPLAARPAHDGDADPAHARADRLRRSRGLRDREAAREPQADRDGVGGAERSSEAYERLRAPRRRAPGLRRLSADRGVGDDARARPRTRRSGCSRAELAGYRVGLLHGRLKAGRAA